MRINKNRELLETEIKSFIPLVASTVSKDEVDLIVEHLNKKHGIRTSDIYSLFNNVNNIGKLELEELALFGQQCVINLNIDHMKWMNEWFTEREQKEFERFQFVDMSKADEIDFPMVISNVTDLGDGYYNCSLSKQQLGRLYKYGKLNYNPNVQRGMRKVIRYGIETEEPIVIQSKVNEIRKLILENKFRPNTITLNAKQMSSLEGVELLFDASKNTLTITEGSMLDIVDGMHRMLGNYSAYSKRKDLQGAFPITISNKSDEEIKRYQADLDKHTPLTRGRIKELSDVSFVNDVIDILKSSGDLKGRITTSTDNKHTLKGSDFIPYKVLHDEITNVFDINNRLEAHKIAKDINEYLMYLFGLFGKHEKDEYRVLFDADIFEGHLMLVKLMKEQNISYDKLEEIIDIKEFKIDNPRWSEYHVLGNKIGKLTKKDRKNISNYFVKLLKEVNSNV